MAFKSVGWVGVSGLVVAFMALSAVPTASAGPIDCTLVDVVCCPNPGFDVCDPLYGFKCIEPFTGFCYEATRTAYCAVFHNPYAPGMC